MKAGKLDRKIILQSHSSTRNAYGEHTDTWSDSGEVWAAVRQQSGREVFQASQQTAINTVVFTIRYKAGLTPKNTRVLYNGQPYDVVSTNEIGRREGLELITEGRNDG